MNSLSSSLMCSRRGGTTVSSKEMEVATHKQENTKSFHLESVIADRTGKGHMANPQEMWSLNFVSLDKTEIPTKSWRSEVRKGLKEDQAIPAGSPAPHTAYFRAQSKMTFIWDLPMLIFATLQPISFRNDAELSATLLSEDSNLVFSNEPCFGVIIIFPPSGHSPKINIFLEIPCLKLVTAVHHPNIKQYDLISCMHLSCQPTMTPTFFLPPQLIIAVTYPLPLHCCSASNFPILYPNVWCLLLRTALCIHLYQISSHSFQAISFPCTLQLFQTLLQPSEVSACILKLVTTLIFYMGYIRKCRPCNKLHSGLTSNTLSDHIPVTILSVVFLPHCDNFIHFPLLLVRRKRGEENIKCIRFLWIIHYFFSIPSSFLT